MDANRGGANGGGRFSCLNVTLKHGKLHMECPGVDLQQQNYSCLEVFSGDVNIVSDGRIGVIGRTDTNCQWPCRRIA